MSCCGKSRSNSAAALPIPANAASALQPKSAVAALPPSRGAEFEYRGGNVLTVIGQGTGWQYRFVGHSAKLGVDSRDRASLAAVPQLRAVGLRR
jgi:hypothetical protein